MKIKVYGLDVEYDGKHQPIMITLTQEDKDNIAKMLPEATKFCVFPEGWPQWEINEFMEIEDED